MEQHEIITIEDSPVPEEKRGIKRGRGGEQKSGSFKYPDNAPGPSSAPPVYSAMTPSPASSSSSGGTKQYTEMTPSSPGTWTGSERSTEESQSVSKRLRFEMPTSQEDKSTSQEDKNMLAKEKIARAIILLEEAFALQN